MLLVACFLQQMAHVAVLSWLICCNRHTLCVTCVYILLLFPCFVLEMQNRNSFRKWLLLISLVFKLFCSAKMLTEPWRKCRSVINLLYLFYILSLHQNTTEQAEITQKSMLYYNPHVSPLSLNTKAGCINKKETLAPLFKPSADLYPSACPSIQS